MVRNLFLLVLILAGCGSGPVVWQHEIATELDEVAAGIAADSATVVVAGTVSGPGRSGWLVARFRADGREVWRRTWNEGSICSGVALVPDGIVLAGRTVDRDEPVCAVVKYGHDGSLRWQKGLGIGERSWAGGVCALPGGAAVITGAAGDGRELDLLLARLEADGRVNWVRNLRLGGAVGQAVAAGPSGKLAVVAAGGTAESPDIVVVVTDSTGDTIWTRRYDSGAADLPGGITFDLLGNVVATGTVRLADSVRCVILEYDPEGKVIREAAFGTQTQAEGRAVAVSAEGDLFVAGAVGYDAQARAFAFHYRPNATSIWERTLKTCGRSGAVGIAVPNDVYVCATTQGQAGDIVVARLARPAAERGTR